MLTFRALTRFTLDKKKRICDSVSPTLAWLSSASWLWDVEQNDSDGQCVVFILLFDPFPRISYYDFVSGLWHEKKNWFTPKTVQSFSLSLFIISFYKPFSSPPRWNKRCCRGRWLSPFSFLDNPSCTNTVPHYPPPPANKNKKIKKLTTAKHEGSNNI